MSATFLDPERDAAARLIELGLAEDLEAVGDLTSEALIPSDSRATIGLVGRAEGVFAGGPLAPMVFDRLDRAVVWRQRIEDGDRVGCGTLIATAEGPLRTLLTGERTVLNFLTHLSGVATLTRQFVVAVADAVGATVSDRVSDLGPVVLDTRKTLPGWRRLEKYAVRVGGGTNHRLGLFDGCLIKDNHLAGWRAHHPHGSIAAAVNAARDWLADRGLSVPVEVEVDTPEQFADALRGKPQIVLLDNMDAAAIRACVAVRDLQAPDVLLEVSGGVTLANVGEIAVTGVDRISIGRLTHSAPALDLAFDWPQRSASSHATR